MSIEKILTGRLLTPSAPIVGGHVHFTDNRENFKEFKIIMLVLLMMLLFPLLMTLPVLAGSEFSDVPTDHWAHDALTHLYRLGVVNGYPDGPGFRGDQPLTRYEFAVALKHLLEKSTISIDEFPADGRGKLAALVSLYRKELVELGTRVEDLTRDFRLLLSVVGSNMDEIQELQRRVGHLERGAGASVWAGPGKSIFPKGAFLVWADRFAPDHLSGFDSLEANYRKGLGIGYGAGFMNGSIELSVSASEWESDSFSVSSDFSSSVKNLAALYSLGNGTYGGAGAHMEISTLDFSGVWVGNSRHYRKIRPRLGLGIARNSVSLWITPSDGSGRDLYTIYTDDGFFTGSLVTGFEADLMEGVSIGLDSVLQFGSKTLYPSIDRVTMGGGGSGTLMGAAAAATAIESLPWKGFDLDLRDWQLRTSARIRFR
jgi:hypothetical protein